MAFDRQEQHDKITAGLLPGEQLVHVFDCIGANTGFVGVTNRRVILQDNGGWGSKRSAVTSIPYRSVTSISTVSEKSALKAASSSTIAITAGGHTHEAAFKGDDKAKLIHDVVLQHIA